MVQVLTPLSNERWQSATVNFAEKEFLEEPLGLSLDFMP